MINKDNGDRSQISSFMSYKIRSTILHAFVISLVFFPTLALFLKSSVSPMAAEPPEYALVNMLFHGCLEKKFPHVERDTSGLSAFDPDSGRNFAWDKDKQAWIDIKTLKVVCPGSKGEPPTYALVNILFHSCLEKKFPHVERDTSGLSAFDPDSGRNFAWDKDKQAWIDTKTGECVCPKCATKPTAPEIPKAQPGKTTTTPSTTGGAKPQSSVTPPRVVPTIPPGRTATGQSTSLRTTTGPIDQCLVGEWRSESVTSDLIGMASKEEGAGILVTFKSDGTQIIDYNGMQPLKGMLGETNQWSGTATGHISTSDGTATIESVEQSDLVHKYVAPDGTSSSNSMGRTLGPAGLVNNPLDRSYNCTKDTLTYKVPAHTFTFKRIDEADH